MGIHPTNNAQVTEIRDEANVVVTTSLPLSAAGGLILVVDWSRVSFSFDLKAPCNKFYVQTSAIAAALFDNPYLFASGASSSILNKIPIHLIGHSRGGSVMLALAHRLLVR